VTVGAAHVNSPLVRRARPSRCRTRNSWRLSALAHGRHVYDYVATESVGASRQKPRGAFAPGRGKKPGTSACSSAKTSWRRWQSQRGKAEHELLLTVYTRSICIPVSAKTSQGKFIPRRGEKPTHVSSNITLTALLSGVCSARPLAKTCRGAFHSRKGKSRSRL
jgi:hypothetical protein